VTLLEDLERAAAMLDASPLENTIPLAESLREHAARLRKMLERVASGSGPCSPALTLACKTINGGPLK